jgi:SAM-dependent methyltransferase
MKAHLGCGTIYLYDYVNIDVNPFILSEDPNSIDLIKQNGTVFSNYYKVKFGAGSGKIVADKKASLEDLPFDDCSLEEVVLIQVLEHIPAYNISKVMEEIYRILETNGVLIVGVPDIKETANILVNSRTKGEEDWCLRLIYGTQYNKFSHHYCGYTLESLRQLLLKYGFNNIMELPNINFYPSIHIKAIKSNIRES